MTHSGESLCHVERAESLRERWSNKVRLQNELDKHTVMVWDDARNFSIEDGRGDRLLWNLCEDDELIIDEARDIANFSTHFYVGRSGHPLLRMFGQEAGLHPNSTMVPHMLRFQYMVVLSADWAAALADREARIITAMDEETKSTPCAGMMLNRTFGFDGPVVSAVQYLYIAFSCKPGMDGIAQLYGHDLPPSIDDDFIAQHATPHA